MFRRLHLSFVVLLLAAPAFGQNLGFKDVVKKVEPHVNRGKVKRGQTIEWALSVEILEGWHTYPTKQPDPMADAYQNKIKFPTDADVVFVGPLEEPETVEKNEDGTKIAMVEKTGVWKRKLVVRPDAKPGKIKVPVKVTMLVCADRCLAPQTITTEIELTVTDDPPVAVEAKYRAEVDAAKK